LTLRTDTSQVYTAEWQNLIQLAHAKVTATTLKAGERNIVIGAPPRDPSSRIVTC